MNQRNRVRTRTCFATVSILDPRSLDEEARGTETFGDLSTSHNNDGFVRELGRNNILNRCIRLRINRRRCFVKQVHLVLQKVSVP